jgi:hypothetical protein
MGNELGQLYVASPLLSVLCPLTSETCIELHNTVC